MPRLASPRPARCAACYGCPDGRFVDFEAATDGPVFVDADGSVSAYAGGSVTVEQIVLCEACVRAGARLLELSEDREGELVREVAESRAEALAWQSRAEVLRDALSRLEPVRVEVAEVESAEVKPVAPRRGKAVDSGVRERALEMIGAGVPKARVARELGVSVQSVRNWQLKELV